MSDEKKQLQKQAMERLQKGTWSMQPSDAPTAVVAALVQLYLWRALLVKAGLIAETVLSAMAERVTNHIPSPTWFNEAAQACNPFQGNENPEAAMVAWIKACGAEGATGPLGLGLREVGITTLVSTVFPVPEARAALIARLVVLAGAPAATLRSRPIIRRTSFWCVTSLRACNASA